MNPRKDKDLARINVNADLANREAAELLRIQEWPELAELRVELDCRVRDAVENPTGGRAWADVHEAVRKTL